MEEIMVHLIHIGWANYVSWDTNNGYFGAHAKYT